MSDVRGLSQKYPTTACILKRTYSGVISTTSPSKQFPSDSVTFFQRSIHFSKQSCRSSLPLWLAAAASHFILSLRRRRIFGLSTVFPVLGITKNRTVPDPDCTGAAETEECHVLLRNLEQCERNEQERCHGAVTNFHFSKDAAVSLVLRHAIASALLNNILYLFSLIAA